MAAIHPLLKELTIKILRSNAEIESFLETFQLKPGSSVLVSNTLEGISHFEVAQSFNSYFDGLKLIFVTQDREHFDIVQLKKNGFADSFILPSDQNFLATFIENCKANGRGAGTKRYKAIKLIDIDPGENLPFDVRVFLPMNKKYVLLTASGELSEKKHKALETKSTGSVFVELDQVEKFYNFVADKLVSLGQSSNDAVSVTERTEKLQSSVRELFRSVLTVSTSETSYESGRDLLEQSKKVVEKYVQKSTGLDIKSKLKTVLGDSGDAYSHAQTVSTIACLFGIAMGIGQPEDLAIAGLFHDIGINGFAKEISIFDWPTLNDEEKRKYQQHPRLSLNLLKEKKITLTKEISEIIEKHHERVDGKGFPAQLPAHKIPLSAQLLGYADAFEYLSRPAPGTKKLTPIEIHTKVKNTLSLAPELLSKLEKFLLETMT